MALPGQENSPMKPSITVGQRWISETEPELGLGKVLQVEGRTILMGFAISQVIRRYAAASAPIKRVRFRPGDRVTGAEGQRVVIQTVSEKEGLLIYHGKNVQLSESDLSDRISFSAPQDRLSASQIDANELFDLRYQARLMQQHIRRSPARGFVGGRVEQLSYQFYIAGEVASRKRPRVLLADEPGLGKTIEAGLILHHLVITGRVRRALILMPEPLIHQWLVEMLRRFNLVFRVVDHALCQNLEKTQPGVNPFSEAQMILAGMELFSAHAHRAAQAASAAWDMIIVDEAHHVKPGSDAYRLLQSLAGATEAMLLLTATPDQLGPRSHFARLQLLDPARYFDFEAFVDETRHYPAVGAIAAALAADDSVMNDAAWTDQLAALAPGVRHLLPDRWQTSPLRRRRWIQELIDRHGTGRVMFRNTRTRIRGVCPRIARLAPIEHADVPAEFLTALAAVFSAEARGTALPVMPDMGADPRIAWLHRLLIDLSGEKVLLICAGVEKVIAIEAALRQRLNLDIALFHEAMSLIHRDRSAAWFAEPDGARLLIASEIGSEGRNFQFSHHLVLFDLPLDPERMEQRIGRLDRIGQKAPIHIHIPYVPGSPQEVLARWYHEGLEGIETVLAGANLVFDTFGARVLDLAASWHQQRTQVPEAIEHLIDDTRRYRDEMSAILEKGRDRLLEMASFRPEAAETLLASVQAMDEEPNLERFMRKAFRHFGVDAEPLADRCWMLSPNIGFNEDFPGLRDGKMTVTFQREKALSREDLPFLTCDHPMVTGTLERLTETEQGNCAFGFLAGSDAEAAFLVEAIFMTECIAPVNLHADRFLPPTPIRVVIDHHFNDVTDHYPHQTLAEALQAGPAHRLLDNARFHALIPPMIQQGHDIAGRHSTRLVSRGINAMEANLGRELKRLQRLARINPSIRADEIELAASEIHELARHMRATRLRLDAIRLIWHGPQSMLM
jgi:ATP-dependent helicase HepA